MSRVKHEDLLGLRFGRLVVISRAVALYVDHSACWACRCDCGGFKIVYGRSLLRGLTSSCGCFSREKTIQRSTTHGMSHTKTWRVWATMRERCSNPSVESYPNYGGRGIVVCDKWQSFEAFYADMGPAPARMTIERKDNDGPYAPWNCKWATRDEQSRNKRNNVNLTWNGMTLNVAQWAKELALPRPLIYLRLSRGWSIERALSPVRQREV